MHIQTFFRLYLELISVQKSYNIICMLFVTHLSEKTILSTELAYILH